MDPKAVFEALQAAFSSEVVFDLHADPAKDHDPWFFVKPDRVVDVAKHLRDDPDLAFDYMECLTGVDYPDKNEIHLVWHLYSYAKKHRAVMKAALAREAPVCATTSTVWSAANWQERECFDLMGVRFEGHPDLRRIMLPDDWVGHPLRKDYEEQPDYHGIPTTRPNPLELLKVPAPKPAPKPAEAKEPAAKKEPAPKKEPEATKPAPAPVPEAKKEPAAEKGSGGGDAGDPEPKPSGG